MADRTELEKRAWRLAEDAMNWASVSTDGRTEPWDNCGPQVQASLMGVALTHIALQHILSEENMAFARKAGLLGPSDLDPEHTTGG